MSDLSLRMGYFRDKKAGNRVSWDVLGIIVGESKNNHNYFTLFKNLKPGKGLKDAYKASWDRISMQKHTYNRKLYFEEGRSTIGSVHTKYNSSVNRSFDFIYTVECIMEGNQTSSLLEKKLGALNRAIRIRE